MRYRPDIDGLRAVAVLPVILFHCGVSLFSGGYVGVDIFFVISGYLITSILLEEIHNGEFSILRFYERRFRRILPALMVVLIASTLAAAFLFMPYEFEQFGESIASSLLFYSNIYFWMQSGYFAAPAETKPLLHTWSLAVEEQFYIFFPIFLMICSIWLKKRWLLWSLPIFFASLAISAWGTYYKPDATFYLLPTRFWELLVGAYLAMQAIPDMQRQWIRESIAATGAFFIIAAIFLYTTTTPFPGIAALLPCLGTASIIYAGQSGQTLVSKALSLKPVIFTGLISYSLYLWHWPLIVFYKEYTLQPLSAQETTGIIIACTILASLSWRYVERPFRNKLRFSQRAIFGYSALATIVLLSVGTAIRLGDGLPQRFPPRVQEIASFMSYNAEELYRHGSCFITSQYDSFHFYDKDTCLKLSEEKPNYLLVGDSHAAHLWSGLHAVLGDVNIMQATASGCPPVWDVYGAPRCQEMINYIYRDFVTTHKLDGIIIAAKWRWETLEHVRNTISQLSGKVGRIMVVGPIVQYNAPLASILAKAEYRHMPGLPGQSRLADVKSMDEKLRAMVTDAGAEYISNYDVLCDDNTCVTFTENGTPAQTDDSHLTKEGSLLVAQRWKERYFNR